ncbi:hypothetical protein QOZ80_3AG0216030 [Eleusine coracana subsp. coracana]|nr:hypothetical protein QOZ80_3AG0216030 [Eleusine coracana subsp. coracana]
MTIFLDDDAANLADNEAYWGPVLHAIDEAMNLESWDIDPLDVTLQRETLGNQAAKEDLRPGLIQLTFIRRDGESAKPVFRRDNLYLSGFANRFDQYFVLKGHEHVMPGATLLPFGDEYSAFFSSGGLRENLGSLPLGKSPFSEAVSILANNPHDDIDKGQLGPALVTIVVMVPESLRLITVHEKVTQFWASGTVGYLDPEDVGYMQNWGNMSALIMCASRNEPLRGRRAKKLKGINIKTPQEALVVVRILLWPLNFDESNIFVSCGNRPKG